MATLAVYRFKPVAPKRDLRAQVLNIESMPRSVGSWLSASSAPTARTYDQEGFTVGKTARQFE